jgi:hypothetical protein
MKLKIKSCVALAVLAIASNGTNGQVLLIGNYPADDGRSTTLNASSGFVVKGFSFTTPAQDYSIDSVVLRLQNYSTTGGDTASVSFFTHDTSNPGAHGATGAPGSMVGAALTSPTSSSTAVNNFTFTPGTGVTLTGSTTYWLVVRATAGAFDWNADSAADTPTGLATAGVYKQTTGAWGTNPSTTPNTFDINATAVPEPAQVSLAAGALLAGFAAWRQRRSRRA